MSITCEACGLSYAGGRGLRGVLAQPRRVTDPRFLRMLAEVPRFHRAARALLEAEATEAPDPTWGEFLAAGAFSEYFVRHFALPLVACVWSAGDADAAGYPARHLFRFLDHHGMLAVHGLADLAHRHRRLGDLRRRAGRPAARRPPLLRGDCGDPPRRRRRRSHGRRPRRDLRPRRRRHPRRPGPAPPRRRHRGREGGPRRHHLLGQRDLAAPGLLGAARSTSRPGVVELPGRLRPPGPRRARRRSRGELLDEPPARPRRRRGPRRDPQPATVASIRARSRPG